jgi:catechol 2,3-dioxygenase-like lactoylglutathione lyase family enzyme
MNIKWHHSSLAVSSLDLASHFYQEVFGFKETFRVKDMKKEIASITGVKNLRCDLAQLEHPHSQHVLELIAFHSDTILREIPKPIQVGSGHISFIVDDLESAVELVKKYGAEVLGNVTNFSEGKSVYCREPAGSFIELEELTESI